MIKILDGKPIQRNEAIVEYNYPSMDVDSSAIMGNFTISFQPFDYREFQWTLNDDPSNDASNYIESTVKNYISVGLFKNGEEVVDGINWGCVVNNVDVTSNDKIWCDNLKALSDHMLNPVSEDWWTENSLGKKLNFKHGVNGNKFFKLEEELPDMFNAVMEDIKVNDEGSDYYEDSLIYEDDLITCTFFFEIENYTQSQSVDSYQIKVGDGRNVIFESSVFSITDQSTIQYLDFELIPGSFSSDSGVINATMDDINLIQLTKRVYSFDKQNNQLRFKVRKNKYDI